MNGTVVQRRTFCRVCEASCGLVATVEDERITSVAGDPEHRFSRGHFCKKAMGAVEVMYDSDRVLSPLKRVGGPGDFVPVSWDDALGDIAARLRTIRDRDGEAAFATFLGQPPTNSLGTAISFQAFKAVMQTRWNYGVNAEDAAAYIEASARLFGAAAGIPKPDFWRTHFAIIIGANPLVSHGSLCSEPLMRECLKGIVKRGGRVVVVDPRRTETAQGFEHVTIHAGTDAFLLLAMLNEILNLDLVDHGFLARHCSGLETLAPLIDSFDVNRASRECGIEPAQIRELARDFATAPSALIYGRTGTCTQRFGTLVNMLQHLLCLVTGNFDRAGGVLLPSSPLRASAAVSGRPLPDRPSRSSGLPSIGGMLPSRALIRDILEPGEGQVKALMMLGANPLISSAATGAAFQTALESLELHFSLDLYVNESNRHAHYILPVTGMFERDDMPYKYLFSQLRPTLWMSKAVVPPRGNTRDEWRIFNDLCRRLGLGGAYASPLLRRLSSLGLEISPSRLADHLLRTGALGDRYGLRPSGLSLAKLGARHPCGLSLGNELPVSRLNPHHTIPLCPPGFAEELERLDCDRAQPDFPLRLIGMREMLSQNTWLHNVPSLMSARRRHCAHVSPSDAAAIGIADGDDVSIVSASGRVRVEARVSDRLKPGNVALPHGWGHYGGWRRANQAGGVNSNVLASGEDADVEALAGMSILNGIPIRLEP